jgi:hypothetical protein
MSRSWISDLEARPYGRRITPSLICPAHVLVAKSMGRTTIQLKPDFLISRSIS